MLLIPITYYLFIDELHREGVIERGQNLLLLSSLRHSCRRLNSSCIHFIWLVIVIPFVITRDLACETSERLILRRKESDAFSILAGLREENP